MKRVSILFFLLPIIAFAQPDLVVEEFAIGFTRPSEITNAGDERLFLSEQGGKIYILSPEGEEFPTPFLNISDRVDASNSESGLLGIAFPPDYCTSGVFYVNYTPTLSGQLHTRVSRFSVDPDDENLALANSEEVVMEFEQPHSNHNGGHIEFGPDGYLYIGTGDGGLWDDLGNRAQNIMNPLGKMLRIDVSTEPYTIPADNPYANDDFGLDEIWSYGLRNPWKFAFDSESGDMYIGDVGQNEIEEVNYEPFGTVGGRNYGWRCYEGDEEFNMSECGSITDATFPFHQFVHTNQGNGSRCSVTGGRVYRGASYPSLQGKYIYTDYCSDEYWVAGFDGEEWDIFYGEELGPGIVSFGEDVWGEMYAVSGSPGRVYKIKDTSGDWLGHIFMDSFENVHSSLFGTSYQWFFNGEPIANSDSHITTFIGDGVYSVEITTESGCIVNATPLDLSSLSSSDHQSLNMFAIYPNPSKGEVYLKIDTDNTVGENAIIHILSLEGKLLIEERLGASASNQRIDLASLNKGIYFVQLFSDSGLSLGVRRLVIE